MDSIRLEEAQLQKIHKGQGYDSLTPIHCYLILISKLASVLNF